MAAMEVEAAASSVLGASLLSSSAILKLLLLALTLVYLVRTLRPRTKSTCAAPLPPGPVPWPVVGNLPEMLLNKPAFRWIHLMMKEMGTDIACVKLGGVHVVSITCPKIAQEVLKKQDANFVSRPLTFASKTFSGGYQNAVLSPYGDQWKKMRRVLTSEIICPSRHRWLHDKRADEADNLTRYVYNLATTAGAGAVDVRHVARHYCGNVIRRLVFNRRYFGEPQPDGGPGPLEVQHMDAVFTSLGLLYAFCVSDYLPWLLGLDLDGHEKMVREANETVNRLHDTVIDERWRQWKSGGRQEPEDFLDVLITLKDAQGNPLLTIEEVKAQSQVHRGHHVRGGGQPVERRGVGAGGDGEQPGGDGEGGRGARPRRRPGAAGAGVGHPAAQLPEGLHPRGLPPAPRGALQRPARRARRHHHRRLPRPRWQPRRPQPHRARPQPARLGRPAALQPGPPPRRRRRAHRERPALHLLQHGPPRLHRGVARHRHEHHALRQAPAGVHLEQAGRGAGRRPQRVQARHLHGHAAGAARRAAAAGAPLPGHL